MHLGLPFVEFGTDARTLQMIALHTCSYTLGAIEQFTEPPSNFTRWINNAIMWFVSFGEGEGGGNTNCRVLVRIVSLLDQHIYNDAVPQGRTCSRLLLGLKNYALCRRQLNHLKFLNPSLLIFSLVTHILSGVSWRRSAYISQSRPSLGSIDLNLHLSNSFQSYRSFRPAH